MPSYIELNQNASFPSSSGAGKVIFGIDNIGQAVIVNSAGVLMPLSQSSFISASYALTASYAENGGGGGGTGITIPKPIVYQTAGSSLITNHGWNQAISLIGTGTGLPGAISNSWNPELLKLTYQTGDLAFLNYSPKYFLFIYNRAKRYSGPNNPMHPNTRANNAKYGKYFVHPASYTGSYIDVGGGVYSASFTPTATYKNFSNGSAITEYFYHGGPNVQYNPNFTSFTTEWSVSTGSGKPTVLTGFNPLRWYFNAANNLSSSILGNEFFPWNTSTYAVEQLVVKTGASFKIPGGQSVNNPKRPRINLYAKFAIVIQDPANPSKFIIGPMSDTVVIFPRAGYFNDDIDTATTIKYYYAWSTKFA